jgi:trans-aconitate methyltransferase
MTTLRLLQYKRNLLKKDLTAPLFENGVYALDVGCGPGSWVLDTATDYPNSEIEGIDMADTFPTAIHPPNARFSNANLLEPLQFDRKFDFVQMRYGTPIQVFMHLSCLTF